MKKTSNYQLNQWEENDRILMEDFNADNSKIDAAVKGVSTTLSQQIATVETRLIGEAGRLDRAVNQLAEKSVFSLLTDTTTASDANQISLSLGGFALSQWQMVVVDLDLLGNGSLMLRPGDGSSSSNWFGASGGQYDGLAKLEIGTHYQVVFFPLQLASAKLLCVSMGLGGQFGNALSATNGQIYTLSLVPPFSGGTLRKGSRFRVWGVK